MSSSRSDEVTKCVRTCFEQYEPTHVYRNVYKDAYILVYILVYMYVYTIVYKRVYMLNFNHTKGNYEAYECYLGLPMLMLVYFTCMLKPMFATTFYRQD